MDIKYKEELKNFLNEIDVKPKNINLYIRAFSHSSYVNEHKDDPLFDDSYDRLEFLGDSALGLITSNYLFENNQKFSAGDMSFYRSKVIRKEFLAEMTEKIGLDKYILLGKGNANKLISKSIKEDVFEAFIGAMFKDRDLVFVKKFLDKWFFVEVNKVDLSNLKDYKTRLQEHLQADKTKPVQYKVIKEERKQSNKTYFEVEAIINGIRYGLGSGNSKKEAEQSAAKKAFEKLAD